MLLLGAMSEEVVEEDTNAKETVFPQRLPQSIEVPPNVEAKQIVSPFSTLLSYSSNHALLM
jgi:hypothetical protein